MSTQPLYDRESFDEAWPALAERLRRSLTARGVPIQDRDDVVQETALRVYRSWTSLDPNRPAWPFVITVAINFWRDIIRERTGRIAECHPTAHIEVTADLDVERDVMARQELAKTVVAMRSLAPEQRRLLLATEEFADTVRPLQPAERVARMRVRRQLAKTVGRASAALVVLWIRRPARATGAVATAYAGALAAAVLTAPAMVTTPAITALPAPHLTSPGTPHVVSAGAAHARHRSFHVAGRATTTSAVGGAAETGRNTTSGTPRTPVVHTKVCTPARPPVSEVRVVVKVGSAAVYAFDGDGGWQPVAATPKVVARSATGCVAVG